MKSRLGGSSRSLAPSPLPWSLPLLSALLPLLALFVAGCSYNSAAPPGGSECDELRPGVTLRYAYTGFDAGGEAVLHGVLTLVLTAEPADDPAHLADVAGVWSIEAAGEDSGVGPQVGSGRISGVVPGERTCRRCHRVREQFDFAAWWPKIAHGTPRDP